MMRIVSSFWILCWEETFDVSLCYSDPFITPYAFPVHLERLSSIAEEIVRFYVAQLSSALAFLHDNNIMHRLVL